MKKPSEAGILTRAEKREKKNRPRMKMHGKSLLTGTKYAGKKLAKKR